MISSPYHKSDCLGGATNLIFVLLETTALLQHNPTVHPLWGDGALPKCLLLEKSNVELVQKTVAEMARGLQLLTDSRKFMRALAKNGVETKTQEVLMELGTLWGDFWRDYCLPLQTHL